MDNKKTNMGGMSIGITTIVVIFALLSLTIFAVLSISTSAQEQKLAEKYATSVSEYWLADYRCSETAELFCELWESGADETLMTLAAEECSAQLTFEGGAVDIAFFEEISNGSGISVKLRLDENLTILEWKTVTDYVWSPDDKLNVWMGD